MFVVERQIQGGFIMKKTLSKSLIIAMVLMMMFNTVSAFEIGTNPTAISGASDKAIIILGYFQWAGFIIAVGILIFFGIKYVMATANEKADLKGGFLKYVIGAVLIALAPSIASWIFTAAQ
jgi:hypothetical protein